MMEYEQSLFSVESVDPKLKRTADRKNKTKKWLYGYNEEFDFVVISRDGTIDTNKIYNIQGLRIAIPNEPKEIYSRSKKKSEQYWPQFEDENGEVTGGFDSPEELKKVRTIFEWASKGDAFKERNIDYIEEEFNRRENGFWFMNKGEPTYITGSHYMFCQWTKIDIGRPHYREANRIFWMFFEACKADHRCYGMVYLKNRRSGFSFMASSETVNQATKSKRQNFGILSKTGKDAKELFVGKVVPIVNNYPFFFRPIQDGSDKPKSEIVFQVPPKKISRKNMKETDDVEIKGLDTKIDFSSTGDYSYDGFKLKMLVHDESGKWERPMNIKTNLNIAKTCCRLGLDIVGKIMMGSTCGALGSGGREFKEIYEASDLRTAKRYGNGQTETGLYALFIPMEFNFEGTFDQYGKSVFEDPETPILRYNGDPDNPRHYITHGALTHWKWEIEARQEDPDAQNEYYRQFPKTEKHAFRDESINSLFNLTKIHDQIDYNEELDKDVRPVKGNFYWLNGQDSKVAWSPDRNGRFLVSWLPKPEFTNAMDIDRGFRKPANAHLGSFGVDPYDISQAKGTKGSKGSMHGLTSNHASIDIGPVNTFFLEYIARPPEADIFFEDILMACIFYGMPALIESNKSRILYYFKRRRYRGYSMNRPDSLTSKLSYTEKEIGGIPSNSGELILSHANGIERFINRHVGKNNEGKIAHKVPFEALLEDWGKFDITNRTSHDASISSGLAIMANERLMYNPAVERETKTIDLGFRKYNNEGGQSLII